MAVQVHLNIIWLLCAILVVTKVLGKSISTTSFEKDSVGSISRCGVKNDNFLNQGRVRRSAVVGNHWNKTTITYWVVNGPHTPPGHNEVSLSKARIEELVTKAFEEWAPYCGLNFQVWKSNPFIPADITLSFERGNHGVGDVFDGPGKVAAHASFSKANGSQVHFDDDETWVDREITPSEGCYWIEACETDTVNFYPVALHEVGHALGLPHSFDRNSIMYEGVSWHVNSLTVRDKMNMRKLYGHLFDGPGYVVAHANFPREQGSEIHFDNDEIWVDREISTEEANNGLASFYAVALHEIGHALGLLHSDSINSIMYKGSNWHVNSLNDIDISNIQNLYGMKNDMNIVTLYVVELAPRYVKTLIK